MKKKQETFYRLTIKDTANNTSQEQPLAYHTESAALDSAYKILDADGGIGGIIQSEGRHILWSDGDTVIEVNTILI
jgi:hypothetical protein